MLRGHGDQDLQPWEPPVLPVQLGHSQALQDTVLALPPQLQPGPLPHCHQLVLCPWELFAALQAHLRVFPPIPLSCRSLPSLHKPFSHLRVQQELSTSEGASPHPDAKADCSGVFTRIGIKGSLTLRCVTSQQCSHGSFYAIKCAGDLPNTFLSFVPSPAHQFLLLCGLDHSGVTVVLP